MNALEFNLLLKSIRTNARALERIFKFYYPKIVYHIGKKCGKPFAEDVAQDFFKKLLETETAEYIKYPTAWVFLNCESIAKRKLRYDSRYVYMTDEAFAKKSQEMNEDMHDEILKEEVYGELYDSINRLDEIECKIVDMYYWEGYTLKEIADVLGLKYDAVKQRHNRLMKKLKNICQRVTFFK
ncbi:MAG: sigma-70 family RNA polymerase sigma factor [Clostridia bacterium]|nr:sigma-70 family RNA polymerase sigma factor [Clostridia bacterium]